MAAYGHDSLADMLETFGERTKEKLARLYAEAFAELVEEALAATPVATGKLKRSSRLRVNGQVVAFGQGAIDAIRALDIDGSMEVEMVWGSRRAWYAVPVEHRRRFVEEAVKRWPAIVDRVARRLNAE